jgi:hypothetical protein
MINYENASIIEKIHLHKNEISNLKVLIIKRLINRIIFMSQQDGTQKFQFLDILNLVLK